MVNSSMMNRLLSPILAFALAAGCTNRNEDVSEESSATTPPVAEAQEDGGIEPSSDAEASAETVADIATPTPRKLEFQREPRVVPDVLTPEQRAKVDELLSQVGDVELLLPDGPATADPLLPGRYYLSISIFMANGRPLKNQRACRVEVEGPNVKIIAENTTADPVLATFEDGEFLSEPREGAGTYGLEGRIVGPGKVRGTIIPGPVPHPSVEIVEGRWGLDALPLKEKDRKTADAETKNS